MITPSRSRHLDRLSGVVLITIASAVSCLAQHRPAEAPLRVPPAARRVDEVRLVIVADRPRAMIALTTPVVARLQRPQRPVYLLVMPQDELVEFQPNRLVQLLPRSRALVLNRRRMVKLPAALDDWYVTEIDSPARLPEASMVLARRFWQRAAAVVMAHEDQPEAVIYAAAVAAHRKVPLLLCRRDQEAAMLTRAAGELRTTAVVFVHPANGKPKPARLPAGLKLELVSTAAAPARIISLLPHRGRRTVILSSAPQEFSDAVWLAPYISLFRRAPLLLCRDTAAAAVEREARQFAAHHKLQDLRSFTIVGEETLIGVHDLELIFTPPAAGEPAALPEFRLHQNRGADDESQPPQDEQPEPPETEPQPTGEDGQPEPAANVLEISAEIFTVPADRRALPYAVGRFPFAEPAPTSLMMTLGFLREERCRGKAANIALIANPATNYGDLPLCETVTRLTAGEIKNLRVELAAFYKTRTDDPKVIAAINRAHLILYHGHLGDQFLLDDPAFLLNWDNGIPAVNDPDDEDRNDAAADGELHRDRPPEDEEEPPQRDGGLDLWPGPPPAPNPPDGPKHPRRFDGLPVVVLQSCQSLDINTAHRIIGFGGISLLGSTTNIHSASGSTFAKAFTDGLLYGDQTVGEALRDARNYFFCLQDLKNQRGHKEQHKSMRVALSFRLWGDPEIRPLPGARRPPRRAPLTLTWSGRDQLTISLPPRRLAEVKTDRYRARMFPQAQAAGIVRRGKAPDAPRRLMPLYFFHTPVPRGFAAPDDRRLCRINGDPNRTVFRVDTTGTHLYLIHFPKKEKANAKLVFEFR